MNIPAGEFKAKCLKLMDEVNELREEIVITKFGKPVAKLVPVNGESKRSIIGFLKDTVVIKGDIVGPTRVKWEADA
jgi:prevent-host-death family protein